MITIRSGFYETNSSSCHVFIYRPGDTVSVPSSITLKVDNEDTILDTMFNDFYAWFRVDRGYSSSLDDDFIQFLAMLYLLGVKEVKCSDKIVEEIFSDIKNNKHHIYRKPSEALKIILFGTDTKCITLEDGSDFDKEIEKKFGKGYEYIARRLT